MSSERDPSWIYKEEESSKLTSLIDLTKLSFTDLEADDMGILSNCILGWKIELLIDIGFITLTHPIINRAAKIINDRKHQII